MLNEITEKHSYGGNINLNDFKEKKWEVNNKNLIYLLRVEHIFKNKKCERLGIIRDMTVEYESVDPYIEVIIDFSFNRNGMRWCHREFNLEDLIEMVENKFKIIDMVKVGYSSVQNLKGKIIDLDEIYIDVTKIEEEIISKVALDYANKKT